MSTDPSAFSATPCRANRAWGATKHACAQGFRFIGAVRETPTVELTSSATQTSPPHLSIVVLPFANLSGDPEQDYFVDGVTESLTTDLSRIRRLGGRIGWNMGGRGRGGGWEAERGETGQMPGVAQKARNGGRSGRR